MDWLPAWGDVANLLYRQILLFGQMPGSGLDQTAIRRNLSEYEDQCATAIDFIFRFQARQATTMLPFVNQLTPEQRTSMREAGLLKARGGAAETIIGGLVSVAQGMKPANARLMTAALRDTQEVWMKFILPDDRTQIIDQATASVKSVKDDEVRKSLTTFAKTLTMAK